MSPNQAAKDKIYKIRSLIDDKLQEVINNSKKEGKVKREELHEFKKGIKYDREMFSKGKSSFITKLKLS